MSLNTEPVAISAFAKAVLIALTAFGLGLSAEQVGAVLLVVEAGMALMVRAQVAPMASLVHVEVSEDEDPEQTLDF